ncbi:hypothetical protein MCHI_002898 [Candidatus Magnetoovum chiemensis]|nr:hypothetical protein MCHI_002898 [Candidatus Magnetoovum chiemensis]
MLYHNLYQFSMSSACLLVNSRAFSCMLFSLFLHFSFLGDFRKLKL